MTCPPKKIILFLRGKDEYTAPSDKIIAIVSVTSNKDVYYTGLTDTLMTKSCGHFYSNTNLQQMKTPRFFS